MSTFLFEVKKKLQPLVSIAAVAVTLFTVVYAQVITNMQTIAVNKRFYFLASASKHIQASTQRAVLGGGAGYTLCLDDGEYVAYSVYFNEEEFNRAQASVNEQEQTVLVTLKVDRLVFKGEKQKENAPMIKGAFDCLYSCIQLLNGEILRLEHGATQESSKRILRTLKDQFAYMEKTYQQAFPDFAKTCSNAQMRLNKSLEEVVYCKDLRYLLCELSVDYVNLSSEFSL